MTRRRTLERAARVGAVVALAAATAVWGAPPDRARGEPPASPGPASAAAASSSRPLAQRPATGQFEVVDGTVFDPAGVQFVPAGTNMNGPNSFFGEPTTGRSASIGDDWRFNLVRLVTCEPEGCNGNDWVNTTSNDLDAIVAEYTARRIVVLIAYHQLHPGARATPEDIARATAFWQGMAERYADNPYVWFNLYNEPENRYGDYLADLPEDSFQSFWLDQHVPVIDAIRNVGAPNMVVVDEAQTGQGAFDWFEIGPSRSADSAVISVGGELVAADPERRTMFSMHAYDFWGWPAPEWDEDCSGRFTDAQRRDRLSSYLQRVADQDLALMIGELGFFPWEEEEAGKSYGFSWVESAPPCGSTALLAAKAAYEVAPLFDVGISTWHGFDLVEEGSQNWDLHGYPPTNLTRLGRWQYDFAAAQAARPVGSYVPVEPERLLDTRPSQQIGYAGPRPAADQTTVLQVTGAGHTNIPAGAAAAVLTITGTEAAADTYITAWPCDTPRPLASNLNLHPGTTAANLTITRLAADGTLCLYTPHPTHLIADLAGWYPADP